MEQNRPIGIFDSGVGGISVLARIAQILPNENFIYYADTVNFPYGDKEPEVVKNGLKVAVSEMVKAGVKALVIACNTATSVGIEELRNCYDLPIFGMEPALKPAVAKAENRRIAVLATTLTLRESRFKQLLGQCEAKGEIINLPAPGLANLVEGGHYDDEMAKAFLAQLFEGLESIDALVLGCTHYLFLTPLIRSFFPGTEIIDGGVGTVNHLCTCLRERSLLATEPGGDIALRSSAPEFFTPKFAKFYEDIGAILRTFPGI